MSSVFSNLSSGIDSVLGPGYDYASKVPAPGDIGVSDDGSIDATLGDIGALTTYAGYLITGPNLGNKYFMNTAATCADASGNSVDRYHYIDNSNDQPKFGSGNPLSKFANGELQGMLPGLLASIEDLNPLGLLTSLTRTGNPTCQKVTCPVGDVTGTMSTDTQYVLQDDVPDLTANYGCSVVEGFTVRDTKRMNPVTFLPVAAILLVSLAALRSMRG